MGRHWRMVEPKATAVGRRSWKADHKRDPLDANVNRRKMMIINGRKLYEALNQLFIAQGSRTESKER
jgi:hypothetical protein